MTEATIQTTESTEDAAKIAYELEGRVRDLKQTINKNFLTIGALLKEIRDNQYYKLLGYDTITEWLSSPDICISQAWAWAFISLHEVFVLGHNVDRNLLLQTDYTKLQQITPLVRKHPEDIDKWLTAAQTLRRIDLQKEIKLYKQKQRVDKLEELKELQSVENIMHMDMLEGLKTIASNSVDLVITAPPRKTQAFKIDDMLKELPRVMKPGASVFLFCDYKNLGYMASSFEAHGYRIVRDIVWKRKAPDKAIGINTLINMHEIILWATPADKYIYNLEDPTEDIWDISSNPQTEYEEEKPVLLLERIVEMSSDEGHTVLDPFSGVGQTLIAAQRMGRQFLGIEEDELWYKISLERTQKIVSEDKK